MQNAPLQSNPDHIRHLGTTFATCCSRNLQGEILNPRCAPAHHITLPAARQRNFDSFNEKFNDAGVKRFGSGWAWLVRDSKGALQIISSANQDSPLMDGNFPIMGNDVWEHAYYLRYQNRRADYLKAWWDVVNWKEIAERFDNFKEYMKKAEGK